MQSISYSIYEGKINFVEIDIEANPEIDQNAQVMETSTLLFFKDKELLKHIVIYKQKS